MQPAFGVFQEYSAWMSTSTWLMGTEFWLRLDFSHGGAEAKSDTDCTISRGWWSTGKELNNECNSLNDPRGSLGLARTGRIGFHAISTIAVLDTRSNYNFNYGMPEALHLRAGPGGLGMAKRGFRRRPSTHGPFRWMATSRMARRENLKRGSASLKSRPGPEKGKGGMQTPEERRESRQRRWH